CKAMNCFRIIGLPFLLEPKFQQIQLASISCMWILLVRGRQPSSNFCTEGLANAVSRHFRWTRKSQAVASASAPEAARNTQKRGFLGNHGERRWPNRRGCEKFWGECEVLLRLAVFAKHQ